MSVDNRGFRSRLRRVRSSVFESGTGALALTTALVYLFLYTPIAILIALSFNDSRYAIVWQGFTKEW